MKPSTRSQTLLDWYDRHARKLPWRVAPEDRRAGVVPDPYQVWLSEIMLQQTTVQAVKEYFLKFIRLWPDVHALADAGDEDDTNQAGFESPEAVFAEIQRAAEAGEWRQFWDCMTAESQALVAAMATEEVVVETSASSDFKDSTVGSFVDRFHHQRLRCWWTKPAFLHPMPSGYGFRNLGPSLN